MTISLGSKGGSIKSVQRGTITLNGVNTNTDTITAVNLSKSFLSVTQTNSANAVNAIASVELTSTTVVTAVRNTTSNTTTVKYEVVEFF